MFVVVVVVAASSVQFHGAIEYYYSSNIVQDMNVLMFPNSNHQLFVPCWIRMGTAWTAAIEGDSLATNDLIDKALYKCILIEVCAYSWFEQQQQFEIIY